MTNRPTSAYIGASWAVLGVGVLGFLIGLWNAQMMLNEKGYYFTVLLLGLYSAISLQKVVRDKEENIPVSGLYYMLSWAVLIVAVILVSVGLWNATLLPSEKGFYGMAFCLSLFAVITIQKNIRDLKNADSLTNKMAFYEPIHNNHDTFDEN
ncbi:inner membrane protein YiaA [Moraxella oblonga]|uniref:inner membrane protein YiaA n=1 Tax=Moraxella oblonga TaxID=200413 RepID=UPI00082AD5DA|nr:inner membrane protein YiaA [Moraxella oblonga]